MSRLGFLLLLDWLQTYLFLFDVVLEAVTCNVQRAPVHLLHPDLTWVLHLFLLLLLFLVVRYNLGRLGSQYDHALRTRLLLLLLNTDELARSLGWLHTRGLLQVDDLGRLFNVSALLVQVYHYAAGWLWYRGCGNQAESRLLGCYRRLAQ